jgi:hypothetical protein
MSKRNAQKRAYHSPKRGGNTFFLVSLFAVGVVIVGVVIAISLTTQSSQSSQSLGATSSASHYPTGGGVRTVAFGKPGELDVDKDHARVAIIERSLPAGTSIHQLTVLSDENCTPDSQGISHCLNRLSYGSGEITVRHTHKMADVPCLQPGEVLPMVAPLSQ